MTMYCTLDEAKQTIDSAGQIGTTDDALIESAVVAASAKIDAYCGRVFTGDTVATSQIYAPDRCLTVVDTDDISTTTGLIVKTGNDSNYGTTLTSYTLEP